MSLEVGKKMILWKQGDSEKQGSIAHTVLIRLYGKTLVLASGEIDACAN